MVTAIRERWSLKGIQSDMYEDDRRFVVAVAGRNGGKTTGACHHIAGMIKRGELRDGARVLVIAPDYTQLKDGTLKSFDRWFGDYVDPLGIEPPGLNIIGRKIDSQSGPMRYLITGQEVMFRSGMNPDQTRSKEVQLVWLDEAAQLSEQIFTLTNANLRQFGSHALYQTIVTTTPRGFNWIYRRFGEQVTQAKFANEIIAKNESEGRNDPVPPDTDPLIGGHHITTIEAERLGIVRPGYVDELGYEPGSQMYQQEVMAEFVAWTGRVFGEPRIVSAVPKLACVYGGVDLGLIAPSCALVVGVTESGAYYAVEEAYGRMQQQQLFDHIGRLHHKHSVRNWIADNDQIWRMLRASGVPAENPNKTKDAAGAAIGFINSLMSRNQFFIHESCRNLIHEMQTYEYKDVQSGDEVTFLDKVKPHQFDHAIDALRYAILPLSAYRSAQSGGWGSISFRRGA